MSTRDTGDAADAANASRPEFSIRLGAPVYTADDQRAGRVDGIVVDPVSRRLLEVVVHEGGLLTRDVVVADTWIERATPREVRLRLRADELSTLPDFVDTAYVPLEDRDIPPLITWEGPEDDYQPEPVLVPASTLYDPPVAPFAPQIVEERRYTPVGSTDVTAGTPVECSDGATGSVEEVLADSEDGKLSAIVVRIGDRRWRVAAEQVQVVGEQGVKVRVPRDELEPYAA